MKSKIFKKLCSGLLALSMLTSPGIGQSVGELVGTSITVNAADTLTYGDYEYTVHYDNTVTITKYIGSGTDINIPSVIDGKNVTNIGNWAFSECTGSTNITIPDSVTEIGYYAFSGCISLTNITIPNSVTSIEAFAFSYCNSLTSITIPDSMTEIRDCAFSECTGLTNITIPNSVTKIGDCAFSECTGLTNITIPDSVTEIGDYAFSGCTSFTNITIPDSVTEIGDYTFSSCTGLKSITIPNSVTAMGVYVFYHCMRLTSISVNSGNNTYASQNGVLFNKNKTEILSFPCAKTGMYIIPDSVAYIGDRAFCDCTGLTSIMIPNSVNSIGDMAFCKCTGLTSITIPNSVNSIGSRAFYECTSLTSITIPNSVTDIGKLVFSDCDNLTIYGRKDSYADSYAKDNNIPFVALEALTRTVSLDTKGGNTLNSIDLTDASKYGILPLPQKRGYIFKGWSLNETTENKSLFEKDTDIYFQIPDCWRYNDDMIYYDSLIIYCHLWVVSQKS